MSNRFDRIPRNIEPCSHQDLNFFQDSRFCLQDDCCCDDDCRCDDCCCDDCCCDDCCCDDCCDDTFHRHRPHHRPRPRPCQPRPCRREPENLFVPSSRIPSCCDGSLASELRRLIGKKVMICLGRKRGVVCILGVDEKCVKALVVGSGKIIFINIDSIVSFKEVC